MPLAKRPGLVRHNLAILEQHQRGNASDTRFAGQLAAFKTSVSKKAGDINHMLSQHILLYEHEVLNIEAAAFFIYQSNLHNILTNIGMYVKRACLCRVCMP